MIETALGLFFDKVNKGNIRYVVFKSTDSLHLSFAGQEDIDVLIDEENLGEVLAILAGMSAIVCTVHSSLKVSHRIDILLPDFSHNNYFHIDLHTKVPIGLKFNKFKHLPSFNYHNSQYNRNLKVLCASRSDEMSLLLTKLAFREVFICGSVLPIGKNHQFYNDLKSCIDTDSNFPVSFHIEQEKVSIDYAKGEFIFQKKELLRLRRNSKFGVSNIYFTLHVIKHLIRKYKYKTDRFLATKMNLFIFDRRSPSKGGGIIAFIGVDGSGKSTHVKNIYDTLKWKISVKQVYLGAGDGDGWWVRKKITNFLINQKSKFGSKLLSDRKNKPSLSKEFIYFGISVYSLLLAFERYYKVRKSINAANKGVTVISDRWPHNYDGGVLDGPFLIGKRSKNIATRAITKLEYTIYSYIVRQNSKVNFIFLDTSFENSVTRKPNELTLKEFVKRESVINCMKASPEVKTLQVVDTDNPLSRVQQEVFKVVWQCLN